MHQYLKFALYQYQNILSKFSESITAAVYHKYLTCCRWQTYDKSRWQHVTTK